MRHGEDGPRVLGEMMLEPGHRFRVEVVGRLIQQQHVRFLQQQAAERDAAPFSAGEHGDRCVARRTSEGIHRLFELAVEIPCVEMVDLLLQLRLLVEQRVEVRVRLRELVAHLLVLPSGD